ncbi:response regulator [Humisphaera borealis]|uniref:Response regulatory domain-containing protein n=1 Tax=Humisphaera borealis TaxID=2807512 RepID=A0A7M2X1J1_9BACT|nr:hypothetical protein [Humisphaera borealis]QOV91534.1 hypothetical protein IPV69_09315 [Humisphaera borealis]
MSKTVAFIGHCGPDSSYLRLAVSKAIPGAKIVSVDDDESMKAALEAGVDLALFNRVLDYGFAETEGVKVIGKLARFYPSTRMMMVSNYPETQAQALAAGAVPGFGKREIGSPRVVQLLQEAVAETPAK